MPCDTADASQRWSWINGNQLRNKNSSKCLDVNGKIEKGTVVRVSDCNKLVPGQLWSCSEGFIQVGETTLRLNLGAKSQHRVSLGNNDGPWNVWEIFGTTKNICAAQQ